MKNIKKKPIPASQIRIVRQGTHLIVIDSSGKRQVASKETIQTIRKANKGDVVIVTEGLSKAQVGRIVSDIQIGSSRAISVQRQSSRRGSATSPIVTSYSIKLKGENEE